MTKRFLRRDGSGEVGARRLRDGFVLGVLAAMAVAGCRTVYSYEPTPSVPVESAKQTIEASLLGQPEGFRAWSVEVEEHKLSFGDPGAHRTARGVGGRSDSLQTFFFGELGKMDCTLREKGYVVRVFDSRRRFRFLVVIPEEERTRRFMDSMLVMSLQSKGMLPSDAETMSGK